MSAKNKDCKSQFAPNLVLNVAEILVQTAIGLLLTPFFIDELGISAYGIIPIATSLTSYISLISNALDGSVSRYLTASVAKQNVSQMNITFNTAFFGMMKVVLYLMPLAAVVALSSPFFFDISTNTSVAVQTMFMCIFVASLINSWNSSFLGVLFANNRLDYMNVIKIVRNSVQTGLIVILFLVAGPSLYYIGVAYVTASVLSVILSRCAVHRIQPELRISSKDYDKKHFGEIIFIGKWTLIGNLGDIFLMSTSLIITNIMLGSELEGKLSVISIMISFVLVFRSSISGVFTPIIYRSYVSGNYSAIESVCRTAQKLITVVLALPLSIICIWSSQILTVWVGAEFADMSDLVWIAMVTLMLTGSMTAMDPIAYAYIKVKFPGIMSVMAGVLCVVLTIFMCEYTETGLAGVMFAWAAAMIVKNLMIKPVYHAMIMDIAKHRFLTPIIPGLAWFAVFIIVEEIISMFYSVPSTLLSVALMVVVLSAVYVLVVPRTVMDDGERKLARECMPKFLEKHIPGWIL